MLEQRTIPFRGHEWDKAPKGVNGNLDFSLFLGYKLLPHNVLQIKDEEIEKIEDFYGNDLPNKPTV